MKAFKVVLLSGLIFGSYSFADVRPGTSIAASIKAAKSDEVKQDLENLGLDANKADAVIKAVENRVISDGTLGSLMALSDANTLVKPFIETYLPAVLEASSNDGASALMSVDGADNSASSSIKAELAKMAELIIASKNGGTSPVDNLPAIMEILAKVSKGEMTGVEADALLVSEGYVTLPEGESSAREAFRKCKA